MKEVQLKQTIKKTASFLVRAQGKDGSYLSLSSSDPDSFERALEFHSVFSTALILHSLSLVEGMEEGLLKKTKDKAAAFLLSQKSSFWSFNYWARGSEEARKMPYPDDLDDTFCALSALFCYDQKLIEGSVLARAVEILTACEIREGGPYRTWLVGRGSPPIWRDVDLAVNANIGYFLSLMEIDLPGLIGFVEEKIKAKTMVSPYYPTPFPIVYFIARFYRGKKTQDLIKLLLARRNRQGHWGNPLNTALAVLALINLAFKGDLSVAVEYLVGEASKGEFQAYPFYTGVNPARDRRFFAGSKALTAGFCLEALSKYLATRLEKSPRSSIFLAKNVQAAKLYRQIVVSVESRFKCLPADLRRESLAQLKAMVAIDTDGQRALMPYYFSRCLKARKKISKKLLLRLGEANLYGWLAYTVYDNFFDDEGESKTLSVANLCLREMTGIFEEILPKSGFSSFYRQIIDKIDGANTWEVIWARLKVKRAMIEIGKSLPDWGRFEKLAERSLGHGLGPIAILFSLGYRQDSKEVKKLFLFFRHYLIAKQLNDDLHDWEKDLFAGQLTPVVSLVLAKAGVSGQVKLKEALPQFQEIFWNEVIFELGEKALAHCRRARIALGEMAVIVDKGPLLGLLIPLEESANEAMVQSRQASLFLKTYQSDKV